MRGSGALAAAAVLLLGCAPAPSAPAGDWVLRELDGASFPGRATLGFTAEGLAGEAPCNRWSAAVQVGPGGQFDVRGVGGTELACPDLGLEARFYEALDAVTERREEGGALVLSGGGHVLRFIR